MMQKTLQTLLILVVTLISPFSMAAECPSLQGHYSLDPKPGNQSIYLDIEQKGCEEVRLVWRNGSEVGPDYLRQVDGQFHSFGVVGDYNVSERWSWIGVNHAFLQGEQHYQRTSNSGSDNVNSLYYLDASGNLSVQASSYFNRSPSGSISSTYYRIQ